MRQATADLPVAVIGAGPVGLAAAAHLKQRGLPFVVLEAGDDIADRCSLDRAPVAEASACSG